MLGLISMTYDRAIAVGAGEPRRCQQRLTAERMCMQWRGWTREAGMDPNYSTRARAISGAMAGALCDGMGRHFLLAAPLAAAAAPDCGASTEPITIKYRGNLH